MAKGIDGSDIGRYAGLGAGAVAMPVIAAKATFLAPVLNHAIMGYGVMGITVGAVVMAGLGIGLIDKLMFSK